METIDPYKSKETFENWKKKVRAKNMKGLSKPNSDVIKSFIFDFEKGMNVSATAKKGPRDYMRLNTLRTRLGVISNNLEKYYRIKDMTKTTEKQIHNFFSDMTSGAILKVNQRKGKKYKSTRDYIKDFKTFWHWWMKKNRKEGKAIIDITEELAAVKEPPKFVYLTEKQFRQLTNKVKYEYKVLLWFLYDTGIRSPKELMNVRVLDILEDYKELNIRDGPSKTFGRRIKLMLCSDVLKEYVEHRKLKKEDFVFPIKARVVNQYLKRLAIKTFGKKETPGGKPFSELTLYDFRHCAACYWLPRYKSESALKYRFGWKKSDMIHYYTKMLGMVDTISKDDLLIDTTKTEIQQRLEKEQQERQLLAENFSALQEDFNMMQDWVNKQKAADIARNNITKLNNEKLSFLMNKVELLPKKGQKKILENLRKEFKEEFKHIDNLTHKEQMELLFR